MLTNDFDQGGGGWDSVRPITPDLSNFNNVNPTFLDAANSAYYLQQTSQLINGGTNAATGVPTTDKDGNTRINGTIDLGAYEHQDTTSDIAVVPVFHFFDEVATGSSATADIHVYNAGGAVLSIGNVAQTNGLASPFSISSDLCSGETLAHADGCVLTVRFAPTALEYFNDSFDLPSSDPNTGSVTVTVHGVGGTASTGGGNSGSGGGGGGCFILTLLR
jgi:hypothetical protein